MTDTEAVDRAGQEKNRALKRIEFLILAVVRTGPLHGYGVVQEISRRTGGVINVRAGSLYRVLDRLLRRGFLELSDGPPSDDHRIDYRITVAGEAAVRREAELLASIADFVLEAGRGSAG